ncbi:MAG: TIGR01244 family sulfur transferase [Hyphomicrobiaceae bacterium]
MNARQVDDQFAVSGQIAVEDVAVVAAAGFRSMICNRPDGESFDQTDYALIATEAQRCGLEIRWQPVMSGHVSDEEGQAFGEIVAGLPGPVFAYCRSGTRCIVLWSLSQAGHLSTSDIIAAAAAAGYDLSALAPRLESLAAR